MIDLTQDIQQDYLIGEFKTKNGQIILLIIYIPGAGPLRRIARESTENADIYFAQDPIEIQTEVSDTFTTIMTKSCKISLYCKNHLADLLFTGDARNIIVNVWQIAADGYQKCLFAGFVEPNVYNQQFAVNYDTLTLNCTCPLCTFQYYPYKNIQTKDAYTSFVQSAGKVSIQSIFTSIFSRLPKLNLLTENGNNIYFDGSIRPNANSYATALFTDVYLYELMFAGESKDELNTEEEIIESILKYFDLHIISDGYNFFIFNWLSIKNRQTINWYPIVFKDSYYVSQSKMMMFEGDAVELLVNTSDTSDTLPGNALSTDYESAIVYRDNKYINQEYCVLPDGTTAYTGKWRFADLSDFDFIKDDENHYYILVQDAEGNYTKEELKDAPEQCFKSSSFIYSFFIVDEDEYIPEN